MAKRGRPVTGADYPRVVGIRLDDYTADAVKAAADAQGRTVSAFVRDLVAAAVAPAEHREHATA